MHTTRSVAGIEEPGKRPGKASDPVPAQGADALRSILQAHGPDVHLDRDVGRHPVRFGVGNVPEFDVAPIRDLHPVMRGTSPSSVRVSGDSSTGWVSHVPQDAVTESRTVTHRYDDHLDNCNLVGNSMHHSDRIFRV